MNKSEKSEIEKLGEKLQKKIWRENKANLTKDGRRTMSVVEMGRLLGLQIDPDSGAYPGRYREL